MLPLLLLLYHDVFVVSAVVATAIAADVTVSFAPTVVPHLTLEISCRVTGGYGFFRGFCPSPNDIAA